MIIFQNTNYRLSFEADKQTLLFHWEEPHAQMSYEDFQEACSNFLGYGFEYQVKHFLIDVRNFQLQLPAEFPKWQSEIHYPRYYKLGIEKVAYVMPESALAHAKGIEKTAGKFALQNFGTPTEAQAWLAVPLEIKSQ
ncbi:MAG: hypothetical protein AAFS00_05800 [Bacteroidota bacterium]